MRLRPILELIRLPAVFTAPADVLCGIAMAAGLGASVTEVSVAFLLLASICMYAAGMAANDIFDLAVDRDERPERPLPSGRVTLLSAWVLVIVLQACALGLASLVSIESVGCVAATIFATYLYNVGTKATVLGPFIMGACRYGNAMVGLSLISLESAPTWSFLAPITVAVYVAALTFVSGYEVGGGQSKGKKVAIIFTVVSSIGPILIYCYGGFVPLTGAIAAALPPLWLARSAVGAYQTDDDGSTRAFVLRAIHGIVVMNAVVAGLVGHFIFATVIAALLIPARLVGRWFYST